MICAPSAAVPTRPTEGACFGNHGKGVGGQHCPHHVAAHGGHVHAAMAAGGVLWQPWWGRAVAAMVGPWGACCSNHCIVPPKLVQGTVHHGAGSHGSMPVGVGVLWRPLRGVPPGGHGGGVLWRPWWAVAAMAGPPTRPLAQRALACCCSNGPTMGAPPPLCAVAVWRPAWGGAGVARAVAPMVGLCCGGHGGTCCGGHGGHMQCVAG